MKAIQLITLTVLYILADGVQGFKLGCPKPAVQQNFNLSKFLGKWYEIQSLSNMYLMGECTAVNFSMQSPGVLLFQGEQLKAGTTKTMSFTARNHSEPAKMKVSQLDIAGHTIDLPHVLYYSVLSTDYDSYSLTYGCMDAGFFHWELAWIMSRDPTLCEETTTRLRNLTTNIGVDVAQMKITNQNDVCCQRLRPAATTTGVPGSSLALH